MSKRVVGLRLRADIPVVEKASDVNGKGDRRDDDENKVPSPRCTPLETPHRWVGQRGGNEAPEGERAKGACSESVVTSYIYECHSPRDYR